MFGYVNLAILIQEDVWQSDHCSSEVPVGLSWEGRCHAAHVPEGHLLTKPVTFSNKAGNLA
jgi:hypothetical protein